MPHPRSSRQRPHTQQISLIFLVLAAVLGSLAFADALPPRPPVARPVGPPQPAKPTTAKPAKPPTKVDPKQREAAKQKLLKSIAAMRAKELAEVLKPDSAAVAKVVELASGFEDQLVAARQELRQKRSALDALLAQPKPDDPALNRAIDALMAQRKKLEDIEAERTAALRKALTPNQFARVVVAWPRINRRIQEQLYRALLTAKQGAVDVD